MRGLWVVAAFSLLSCGTYRSTGRTEDVRAGATVRSSGFEPTGEVTLDASASLTRGTLEVRVLVGDDVQDESVGLDATRTTASKRYAWKAGTWRFEVTASSDAIGRFDIHLSDR